jgi:hypothetical protein
MRCGRLPVFGIFGVLLFALCAGAAEVIDPGQAKVDPKDPILWYDVRLLGVEGQGWKDTQAPFDRLPGKAEGVVRPPVWGLSRHSAGLCVRFVTSAPAIHARWTLTSPNLALTHMPATGVSGLDLYVKTDAGKWHWLAVGRPTQQSNQVALVSGLPAGEREYLLYLPLYNGVSAVAIGLGKDQKLLKAAPRPVERQKPILFYGTSITQGGCASRPGMVHTAIVGRRLDRPVLNLGFSGNGRMEPEMADLFAELDPAVYVLDCLPNMMAAEVAQRVEPFVQKLRQAHPATPILLVEDRSYANAFLLPGPKQRNQDSRVALKKAYERLQTAGVQGLVYLPGDKLLGEDGEDTVDSSHPTDLGFLRQAEAFLTVLEPLLSVNSAK